MKELVILIKKLQSVCVTWLESFKIQKKVEK